MPWRPMRTAPKDGTAILVLISESDIPYSVRWLDDGWHMTWDGHRISTADGPLSWMPIPANKRVYPQQPARADEIGKVRKAITEYHVALDKRQHADAAANTAINAIESALGMPWVQGKALRDRGL